MYFAVFKPHEETSREFSAIYRSDVAGVAIS